MTIPLEKILSDREMTILVDKYIRKYSAEELKNAYGLIEHDLREVKRKTIYAKRIDNHYITRKEYSFNEPELVKSLWKVFIKRETSKGKTSRDIANEIHEDLSFVNSHF